LWISGVMQGLMWRAVNADGTLTYSFVEGVKASYPYWTIRLVGGTMFFVGMLIMTYNVVRTVRMGSAYDAPIPLAPPVMPTHPDLAMSSEQTASAHGD